MKKNKKLLRAISLVCGSLGLMILAYISIPIFSYQLNAYSKEDYISPLPDRSDTVASGSYGSIDYTKASNWFVGNLHPQFIESNIKNYTISIPKLGISDASVAIGGEDLAQSLIHFPGTAVPGRHGNAVVFGHSILPQFFNPEDYMSIFSTIPTLKKGDDIKIEYDGVSFTYRVEDKFEVLPTDVQILEQNTSDSYLSLVTCVPPGDPRRPKRLIVRARVVPVDQVDIN